MLDHSLIIAPLEPELSPVIAKLESLGLSFKKSFKAHQVIYKCLEKPVILATCGLGKVSMALQIVSLHSEYNFKQVLGIGSCGALNSDLKLGSCHLISKCFEHDFKTCMNNSDKFPSFTPDTELNLKLSQLLGLPKIIVASGDETINTANRAQELRKLLPAGIVTWETAGLARACEKIELPWAEIRMVSDYCDLSNFKTFKKQVSLGMPKVGEMIYKLFKV